MFHISSRKKKNCSEKYPILLLVNFLEAFFKKKKIKKLTFKAVWDDGFQVKSF